MVEWFMYPILSPGLVNKDYKSRTLEMIIELKRVYELVHHEHICEMCQMTTCEGSCEPIKNEPWGLIWIWMS